MRRLAEHFKARGAAYMDLSVLHDNEQAIALYEKLGFARVPVFAVKRKNPINERLFAGRRPTYEALNPYARIIVDEARRRGIGVEVTDAEGGFFRLTHGGRSIHCRESLSELTSGVAMSICDDKAVTRRVVAARGRGGPGADRRRRATPARSRPSWPSTAASSSSRRAASRAAASPSASTDAGRDRGGDRQRPRSVCDRVLLEACFDGRGPAPRRHRLPASSPPPSAARRASSATASTTCAP